MLRLNMEHEQTKALLKTFPGLTPEIFTECARESRLDEVSMEKLNEIEIESGAILDRDVVSIATGYGNVNVIIQFIEDEPLFTIKCKGDISQECDIKSACMTVMRHINALLKG